MFNAISWQGYWTTLALLTALYYFVIALLYFRDDVLNKLQQLKAAPARTGPATLFDQSDSHQQPPPSRLEEDPDFQPPPVGTETHAAYACMDELNAFFESAKGRKWSRAELVQSLRNILSKYPALRDSGYKTSMGHVIVTLCEQYCSIRLKAEDVVGLW